MPVLTERTRQEVEFKLYAPDARTVFVAGQFNAWDPGKTPMKKSKDGTWKIKVKLPPGRCEYKFFVDGAWMQDLPGAGTTPNPFGTNNRVIDVH
jgi:1,4-alpha-glucan branching enzyme